MFSHIRYYSVASTEDAAYIIGGYDIGFDLLDIIAEFRNYRWYQKGKLNFARNGHASITLNDQTMVLGGVWDGLVKHLY